MDDTWQLIDILEARPSPYTLSHLSHPDYDSFQQRLRSFQTWHKEMAQTPYDMAMAGYFYHGRDDRVICYCCRVTLCQWEATDKPWKEHLNHAKVPCEYLCVFCPDGEVNEKYRRLLSEEAWKRRAVTRFPVHKITGMPCVVMWAGNYKKRLKKLGWVAFRMWIDITPEGKNRIEI